MLLPQLINNGHQLRKSIKLYYSKIVESVIFFFSQMKNGMTKRTHNEFVIEEGNSETKPVTVTVNYD